MLDKEGNALIWENGVIRLQLKGEKRQRILGHYNHATSTFRTFRKVSKHTHRKLHSIGFNYALIHRGKFETVEVELDSGEVLVVERSKILEKGSVKHFMKTKQPYELQIFLPLKEFDNGKRGAAS